MEYIRLVPLARPVETSVSVPGSKSYTNRALIMAAMTKGSTLVKNPLVSDDTDAMLACLLRLGIEWRREGDAVRVVGDVSQVKDGTYDLDADLSGTTIRFLLPLACSVPGAKRLYGKEGLNKRPIGDLVDGLRELGASIDYLGSSGSPPLSVTSSKLDAGAVHMKGGVSSQYFSAVLMAAPLIGDLTIEVVGEQISKPYVDMTIDMMKEFGVAVENDSHRRYRVAGGQQYKKNEYRVEGDVSSASYFAAIAAVTSSTITLTNMNPHSAQADMAFFEILKNMGAEITSGGNEMTVKGKGVRPLDVGMENCPDQAQTLAVLAAFAPGVTRMSGIRSLRVKETERVVALEQELAKMDVRTESTHDTLTVWGGDPKPARIDTYGDHRMAMSFAVAGSVLNGMEINDPGVVQKTFPAFWEKLEELGVGVSY